MKMIGGKYWGMASFFCLLVLLSLLVLGCHSNGAAAVPEVNAKPAQEKVVAAKTISAIKKAALSLQDGDLVTRSDNDFESLTLQNFSDSDRTYSHSGIAFKEENGFVVYHSMTGTENPSGLCRKDPFDSFVSPVHKTGFGIFRYSLSKKEKEAMHGIMRGNLAKKIPFDLTFNIHTNDSLYCSEMIYKALKASTNGRVALPTSMLYNFRPKILGYKYNNAFLKEFEYISIDNLYLNPFCKEVIRVVY